MKWMSRFQADFEFSRALKQLFLFSPHLPTTGFVETVYALVKMDLEIITITIYNYFIVFTLLPTLISLVIFNIIWFRTCWG